MSDMIINIATDFYPRPAGRFSADGEYTGETFRDKVLTPKLEELQSASNGHLIIDFTGVTMAGSSSTSGGAGSTTSSSTNGVVRSSELTTWDDVKAYLITMNK